MLQIFSKNISTIVLDNINPQTNIDMINEHIKQCSCQNMTVDIRRLNLIDACKVSTLCSTTHYMKYPDGKINWIVNSKKVKDYTDSMNLGNSSYLLK